MRVASKRTNCDIGGRNVDRREVIALFSRNRASSTRSERGNVSAASIHQINMRCARIDYHENVGDEAMAR